MILNNIDLQKPLEKLFIRTSNETYAIEGKTVKCWVEAHLCARYKSGKTDHLAYTVGKGKAVCSAEDKFDANIGLRLAAARAESNYCERFSKLLEEAKETVADYNLELTDLILNCNNQVIHNKNYIEKIIDNK